MDVFAARLVEQPLKLSNLYFVLAKAISLTQKELGLH